MIFASIAVAAMVSGAMGDLDTHCPRVGVAGVVPGEVVVGDGASAASIAEIILSKIYGKNNIKSQMPFKVTDNGEYYIVSGSLHNKIIGGVAKIAICKINGQVTMINHTK